jgi:uncharacterized protein
VRHSGVILLLTHGAGSNADSALLLALDVALGAVRFNLPYREKRPTGPPRHGDDVEARAEIRRRVERARAEHPGEPVVAGGHSYGGRQTSMLAAEHPSLLDGLLLLSYPLHPPRKPDQLRTAHFPAIRTPALFIHGTRDPFGLPEEMRTAVEVIPARKQLVLVERAGHELTSPEIATKITTAFREFFG